MNVYVVSRLNTFDPEGRRQEPEVFANQEKALGHAEVIVTDYCKEYGKYYTHDERYGEHIYKIQGGDLVVVVTCCKVRR